MSLPRNHHHLGDKPCNFWSHRVGDTASYFIRIPGTGLYRWVRVNWGTVFAFTCIAIALAPLAYLAISEKLDPPFHLTVRVLAAYCLDHDVGDWDACLRAYQAKSFTVEDLRRYWAAGGGR